MAPNAAIPASAHDVARELRRRVPGIGMTVLQKLLYYSQGWHLAHTGRPMFSEHLEAWANGPVVASLWREETRRDTPPPEPRALPADALATVGYVVSRYGQLSAAELIALTHDEDPWRGGG